uniref:HEPN domain-containing protein n=1 Tax=Yersinia massiliensis TaxID=419257 RepID=UPI001C95080F
AFTIINRKIVIMLENAFKTRPKVLWDDLSSYYSSKTYPLLNEIENLMRKLLTKLLIIKVGINWEKDNVPQDIKQSMSKKSGRDTVSNYLSGTDFIDLTTFIFKKYSNLSNEVIFESILNCKDGENFEKVKQLIPKSNWERFLSPHIDTNEKALSESWNELYILRCAVAHNADFRKKDYLETKKLINKIKPILLKSIAGLEIDANQPLLPAQPTVDISEVNESLKNSNTPTSSLLTSEAVELLREQVSASEFLNLARNTPNLMHISRAAQEARNLSLHSSLDFLKENNAQFLELNKILSLGGALKNVNEFANLGNIGASMNTLSKLSIGGAMAETLKQSRSIQKALSIKKSENKNDDDSPLDDANK